MIEFIVWGAFACAVLKLLHARWQQQYEETYRPGDEG